MHFIYNYKRRNIDEFINVHNVEFYGSEQRSAIVKNQSKGTQTDYRENETQTIPWEPPYRLQKNIDRPEVLDVNNLRWNDGLPLGINEINIVKKMRMKRAWESVLPPLDSKVNIQTHNFIIAMIDNDKWASRDKELQLEMDLRLALMNEMIKQNNIEQKNRIMQRLEKIGKHLNQIRTKEIMQIKRELNRKLRKLNLKYRGINSKIILNTIYNKKMAKVEKDLYISKSKSYHESLNSLKQFYDTLLGKKFIDDYKQTDVTKIHAMKINHMALSKCNHKQSDELCFRETRWSDKELQNLHEDLKNIRLNETAKKGKIQLQRRNKVYPHYSASF
ncbi:hypothetical protein PV326_009515 [Microctonus aethiopoides]|nr:hypothetical protein PV326_009515 [Microctonus aethiopoides]